MGSKEPELQGGTEEEHKQKRHTPTHKKRETAGTVPRFGLGRWQGAPI
jgi:hypothetical protein